MSLAARLYRGEVSYDYIARRRRWYALSALVLALSIASLLFRGFNYGIEFKGGASFQFPANGHTVSDVRAAIVGAGVPDPVVQQLTSTSGAKEIRVTTRQLTQTADPKTGLVEQTQVENALSKSAGVSVDQLNQSNVGASWGGEITKKAIQGLVVFLVFVVLYIALRFEPKMALAAIIALLHDMLITAGIYSLVGFEVTPSTVIALLTILGFSLYDTVVVFDKVRENTASLSTGKVTYSQAANLAVNQTIMRSINTSLIALMPVASLLFVGAGLLGAGTLKDLALAQFVGLASGAYSSIFVATPLLTDFKEREPAMQQLAARVARASAKAAPAGAPKRGRAASTEEIAATTAVAVAEREDEEVDERSAASASGTQPFRAPAPARPGASAQRKKRGGRPGRPSGKRKR